jgi:Uma2 family endonuclease
MATAEKTYLTEAQYLAHERAADFRSEYLRGEMFAMAGASHQHSRIKANAERQINNQLAGGPCYAVSSDQRVKVPATRLYTYPDIVVVCGRPEFEDDLRDTLLNPRVIFEILSETTEAYDRGAKFGHYRQLASMQEYVLVAQDRPLVERYLRQPNGDWVLTEFSGLAAIATLATIAVRLPLAEIYAGIELTETPGH